MNLKRVGTFLFHGITSLIQIFFSILRSLIFWRCDCRSTYLLDFILNTRMFGIFRRKIGLFRLHLFLFLRVFNGLTLVRYKTVQILLFQWVFLIISCCYVAKTKQRWMVQRFLVYGQIEVHAGLLMVIAFLQSGRKLSFCYFFKLCQ